MRHVATPLPALTSPSDRPRLPSALNRLPRPSLARTCCPPSTAGGGRLVERGEHDGGGIADGVELSGCEDVDEQAPDGGDVSGCGGADVLAAAFGDDDVGASS